jgi:hypothetical protein
MSNPKIHLAGLCVSVAVLSASVAQAMQIQQFDKMTAQDQADYITALVDGAQKVLIDEGRSDLGAQVHKLFTDVPAGDTITLGMEGFETNLAQGRLYDAERYAKDHNVRRLNVEDAMIVTLKKNGIVLPLAFVHVADGFHPKFPLNKN